MQAVLRRISATASGIMLVSVVLGMALAASAAGQTLASKGAVQPVKSAAKKRSAWQRWKETNAHLHRHGVSLSGWVQMDGSTVVTGGIPDANGFVGQYLIDLVAAVDTDKLLGWPGGTLTVEGQSHSGSNLLEKQLPAIQDPENLDAPPGTWLAQLVYEQDMVHGKIQTQGGLMYVDSRFLTVPYGGNFISLDFSSDASISTFVLPTYPKGSWGGDVTVAPVKGLSFAGGVYNDHSTELDYDPGGALLITEEAWKSRWRGLPYKLQVGAWRDTGKFERFQGGTVHHASGVYIVASGMLWQPQGEDNRGVHVFFQYGAAAPSVAVVHRHVGAGVVWNGPSKARQRDEIGLAFSTGLLTRQSTFRYESETEEELYYRIYVLGGLTVQPDVQFWQNPGGNGTPNTVLGLGRIMYSF